MNNIEKLAIEHVQFNGDCEGHELYCFTEEQLEAFAKALQSSEPVAEVEDGILYWIKPKEVPNECLLFTHPTASVPLEKYNKLLDGIRNALYQDLNDIKPYLRKLIAEAEGKEG